MTRCVAREIDFRLIQVDACLAKERDHFGRPQYRPLVTATLGGTLCSIVPLDVGVEPSRREAIYLGEKWADLV